ncbi:S-methyl-5-thioribose kinase [Sutcliffiella rhizosphaerae]|uniref:Methylthioribose kinase n=1 Tax=Sutcliffiella rhizosphaerae TaxID=2880967 RepID=A0ABM8YL25_9BACI|nr:S-methyl-5-thioribose kinase [Sutcliffiella rhizosphaerae]CAG9620546.1 Methylthioribose kinase [Sutcliffiella rhizosphaerae]
MTVTTKGAYEPLTESTAIKLAKELNFFKEGSLLSCHEIGDGNLNLVFHIVDENNTGIIIKQALPYAKVVGESWPLTLHRATIEGNYLKKAASLVPNLVPKVYYTNEALAITIMEDLSHLEIARSGFIKGKDYPLLSLHIGEYLAKTLFFTSDFGLNQQEKKKLQQLFVNPELCKITEDLVFTDPFFDSETNDFEPELLSSIEDLWADQTLKREVAKLKLKFLTNGEALLHGDLHTGSIFANEIDTKVIDPEFAFFGPIGFDIGQFFANILFQSLTRTSENRKMVTNHLHQAWDSFVKTFTQLWNNHSVEAFTKTPGYIEHVFSETFKSAIGFAGCEIIRRTIGLSHVADLDSIFPDEERIFIKQKALSLGKKLILKAEEIQSTTDIEKLLEQVLKEKD